MEWEKTGRVIGASYGRGRKWSLEESGDRAGERSLECSVLEGKGGHVKKENMVSSAGVEAKFW